MSPSRFTVFAATGCGSGFAGWLPGACDLSSVASWSRSPSSFCMFASYDERSARSSFSSPCTCSRILATFSALVGDPVTGEVLASAAGFTVFRPSISYCISSMRACAPAARRLAARTSSAAACNSPISTCRSSLVSFLSACSSRTSSFSLCSFACSSRLRSSAPRSFSRTSSSTSPSSRSPRSVTMSRSCSCCSCIPTLSLSSVSSRAFRCRSAAISSVLS
mmetsp:Transcript_52802/g.124709  ORF Transcript_52802/g.124709 Transcript_52802/m.124709 type:complete len:221 (+) Transcript_52802:315-977(+)